MSRVAYFRVSTADQLIDAQRAKMEGPFDREFVDNAVSGSTMAQSRPGFSAMLQYVREGDTLYLYAVDRLGRDAIDIQTNVRELLEKGVTLHVRGLGPIGRGVGELIIAVLAQIAEMERQRIFERTQAGRAAAMRSIAAMGRTHRGKESLGRPQACDPTEVRQWRQENNASIAVTCRQFGISPSTVKRYCRTSKGK
ncbi:recombinase family protein [Sphingobium yanoikuyae]|uniref:recombinase family protein n=1 Tax=Sphingobium sp. DN12 TaxID=3378073 RepID=UPI0035C665FC